MSDVFTLRGPVKKDRPEPAKRSVARKSLDGKELDLAGPVIGFTAGEDRVAGARAQGFAVEAGAAPGGHIAGCSRGSVVIRASASSSETA